LDGTCIGVCDTVLVLLGQTGPTPISDEFRVALETVLLKDGQTGG
jgi:acyl-CoA thioester hydrolase